MEISKSTRVFAAVFLCLIALIVACNGTDNPVEPVVTPLDLNSAWPNEDGRYWKYDLTQRNWTGDGIVYTEEPPPPPSLDDVAGLLGNQPVGDGVTSTQGFYDLLFDGMITTESGAVGQSLRESLYTESVVFPTQGMDDSRDEFLSRLVMARPDLVEEYPQLRSYLRANRFPSVALWMPLLIHGYAWEKTDSYIGTYGDVDQQLAWMFLDRNLRQGHEFVFQLLPSITDDVFLHARILRRYTVDVPDAPRSRAVDVLYMVDYGLSEGTGPSGEPTGYSRSIDYGTVSYAAEIGPIACYERKLVSVADTLGVGFGDIRIDMIETGAGDPGPLTIR